MLGLVLAALLMAPVADEDLARYDLLIAGVGAAYDSTHGGFVERDGNPSEASVELAFRLAADRNEPAWSDRAIRTVDWMLALYDTVGGGFMERARDMDPARASFEKTTWSNGERMLNLLDAGRYSSNPRYRKTAGKVVDFADRVLLDGRGGFVHGQVGDRQLVPESNGSMIRSWLAYATLDNNRRMRDFAHMSLDRVWKECWLDGPGLVRRDVFGVIQTEPRLADQTEMGRAYVWSAHLTGREIDLAHARQIADQMLASYEQDHAGFRTVAMLGKKGAMKRASRNVLENARAARFLAELAAVSGESKYREAARRTMLAFEKNYKDQKLQGAEWALALRSIHIADLPARPTWAEPAGKTTVKITVGKAMVAGGKR